jgi:hypothetical protein
MNNKKLIIFAIGIFALSLITAITTFPGIPHQFYGKVILNGISPNSGNITAKINGQLVGTTNINAGQYGYKPIFYIEDKDYNRNGKIITFYVNGFQATNYTFENGASTRLDLIIGNYTGFCGDGIIRSGEECDSGSLNGKECDNSEEDCTYCSSSCQKIDLFTDTNHVSRRIESLSTCEPNWKCSNWGECVDGIVKRTCQDSNGCGVNYGKPVETKGCDELLAGKISLTSEETAGSYLWLWIFLALIVILVIVVIMNKIF